MFLSSTISSIKNRVSFCLNLLLYPRLSLQAETLLIRRRQIFSGILVCHFHSSGIAVSQYSKNQPTFNYGLTGKGKSSSGRWSNQANKIHVQGEIVFGIHPVTLALKGNHRQKFYKLYLDNKHLGNVDQQHVSPIKRIQTMAAEMGVSVEYVHKSLLNFLAGSRPHQGVCLDARPRVFPQYQHDDLLQKNITASTLWLLLYNVQDPMNFGAILRSSYFFGVDKILVPSENSCAASPVVSKASSGALEVMDILQVDGKFRSISSLTQKWQSCGGKVVGTAGASGTNHTNVCSLENYSVSAPTLLIVGNEGSGIDTDVLDLCDTLLTVSPRLCKDSQNSTAASLMVESLNVSVATGILIHWLQFSRILRKAA